MLDSKDLLDEFVRGILAYPDIETLMNREGGREDGEIRGEGQEEGRGEGEKEEREIGREASK